MPTALVIEDDATNRENLVEVLEFSGYTVFSAPNGLEGIESAKRNLPDFILSDVMMPDVSGYSVVLELKNDPLTCKIPVIIVTSLAEEKEIQQGMELGVFGYLVKPFDVEMLEAMIASCLKLSPGV